MFDRITSVRGLTLTSVIGVVLVAGMICWTQLDLKHFIQDIGPLPNTKSDVQTPRNQKIQGAIEKSQPIKVNQVDTLEGKQANGIDDTKVSSYNEALVQENKPENKVIKRRRLSQVSPHGFGPYPKVPETYMKTVGVPSWMETKLFGFPPASREQELMSRVMLKLWKEGHTNVEGAIMQHDGRMLINYKNRAYVRYATRRTSDGKTIRYIAGWTSGSLKAPSSEQLLDGYIPSGVVIIDLDQEDPTLDPI